MAPGLSKEGIGGALHSIFEIGFQESNELERRIKALEERLAKLEQKENENA